MLKADLAIANRQAEQMRPINDLGKSCLGRWREKSRYNTSNRALRPFLNRPDKDIIAKRNKEIHRGNLQADLALYDMDKDAGLDVTECKYVLQNAYNIDVETYRRPLKSPIVRKLISIRGTMTYCMSWTPRTHSRKLDLEFGRLEREWRCYVKRIFDSHPNDDRAALKEVYLDIDIEQILVRMLATEQEICDLDIKSKMKRS